MAKAKKTSAAAKQANPATVRDYATLLCPVVTEKSSMVGASGSVVTFRVAPEAGKEDIKRAVERVYKVEVAAVRTMNFMGKPKRTTRSQGRRAGYKKALVTLKEGHSIAIVEGV